jgi:hypothetical protein
MRRILLVSAIAMLLSGCVTAEERNAQIAASDDGQCQSYGAAPGSQEYYQCRMTLNQQRQANNLAVAQMWINRPQPAPYVLPMPQRY